MLITHTPLGDALRTVLVDLCVASPMTGTQLMDALAVVLSAYQAGAPDFQVLMKALGVSTAYALTMQVRAALLLPDQITDLLEAFCASLRKVTGTMIREADAREGAWDERNL